VSGLTTLQDDVSCHSKTPALQNAKDAPTDHAMLARFAASVRTMLLRDASVLAIIVALATARQGFSTASLPCHDTG